MLRLSFLLREMSDDNDCSFTIPQWSGNMYRSDG